MNAFLIKYKKTIDKFENRRYNISGLWAPEEHLKTVAVASFLKEVLINSRAWIGESIFCLFVQRKRSNTGGITSFRRADRRKMSRQGACVGVISASLRGRGEK